MSGEVRGSAATRLRRSSATVAAAWLMLMTRLAGRAALMKRVSSKCHHAHIVMPATMMTMMPGSEAMRRRNLVIMPAAWPRRGTAPVTRAEMVINVPARRAQQGDWGIYRWGK